MNPTNQNQDNNQDVYNLLNMSIIYDPKCNPKYDPESLFLINQLCINNKLLQENNNKLLQENSCLGILIMNEYINHINQINQVNYVINFKNNQIELKDNEIKEKNNQIEFKDNEIETKNKQIEFKDNQIKISNEIIKKKDQDLIKYNGTYSRYWSEEEHNIFLKHFENTTGKFNFKEASKEIGSRTYIQVRSHHQKYLERIAKNSDNNTTNKNNKRKIKIPKNSKKQQKKDIFEDWFFNILDPN